MRVICIKSDYRITEGKSYETNTNVCTFITLL